MRPEALLQQPLTLPCGAVLKNRLGKSAMSEALGTTDNRPKPELAKLYRVWAQGGTGLVITGNVMIDRKALGEPNNVALQDDQDLAALKSWAEAGKENNTHIWVQLNHPGKQSPKGLNEETVSPSAIPFRQDMQSFFATPRELTEAEILQIIQRFATAAKWVKEAGFTGVQIHGAHGYLVSQFLSPHHNQRTDQWGGSPENRRRFVVEVYKAMRAAVGPEFPVSIKINSADFQRGGLTEEEAMGTVQLLADLGMDLIEISGGTYEAPTMAMGTQKESTRSREAYFLEFAEKARAVCKAPLMVTGGFRTLQGMAAALESGSMDVVGLGRLLAVEPDASNRLLAGKDPVNVIKPIKTGISLVDNMGLMEVSWYQRQIHRMAKGQQPKPNESALWSFLNVMAASGIKTWKTRRLRA
ncbi:MAG TPA: NADH:flavin oxidoreductase/NADH oxidase family protein [Pseudomonadales bacterium]|nr:NADH:flavin oxidoreductase/NADH oxidase family protein [Pseudomonadales bacterium]